MNHYSVERMTEGKRRLLRALGIEVVEVPEDAILFPYCSSGGYYLTTSDSAE